MPPHRALAPPPPARPPPPRQVGAGPPRQVGMAHTHAHTNASALACMRTRTHTHARHTHIHACMRACMHAITPFAAPRHHPTTPHTLQATRPPPPQEAAPGDAGRCCPPAGSPTPATRCLRGRGCRRRTRRTRTSCWTRLRCVRALRACACVRALCACLLAARVCGPLTTPWQAFRPPHHPPRTRSNNKRCSCPPTLRAQHTQHPGAGAEPRARPPGAPRGQGVPGRAV